MSIHISFQKNFFSGLFEILVWGFTEYPSAKKVFEQHMILLDIGYHIA